MIIQCKNSFTKTLRFEGKQGAAAYKIKWREVEVSREGLTLSVEQNDGSFRGINLPETVSFADDDDGIAVVWKLPEHVTFIDDSIWPSSSWEVESGGHAFEKKLYRFLDGADESGERTTTPTGFTEAFLSSIEKKLGLKLVSESYDIIPEVEDIDEEDESHDHDADNSNPSVRVAIQGDGVCVEVCSISEKDFSKIIKGGLSDAMMRRFEDRFDGTSGALNGKCELLVGNESDSKILPIQLKESAESNSTYAPCQGEKGPWFLVRVSWGRGVWDTEDLTGGELNVDFTIRLEPLVLPDGSRFDLVKAYRHGEFSPWGYGSTSTSAEELFVLNSAGARHIVTAN